MVNTRGNNGRLPFLAKFERRQTALFNKMAANLNGSRDANVQACLDATFGQDASIDCLLGSNGVERCHVAARLASEAINLSQIPDGQEFAVVYVRDQTWAFERTGSVFDVRLIRRLGNHLKKIGDSTISAIQLGCLPSPGGGFLYVPQVKIVVFGRDLRVELPHRIYKLQAKFQRVFPDVKPIELCWIDKQTKASRYKHVAKLLDMRDPFRGNATGALTESSASDWKACRVDRLVERYQVLAMCTLDKLVMATGNFEPVLAGALREAAGRARTQYRSSDKPLHRDQIVHFWIERQLSRKHHFVPPFVKLR